jgi:hypothetical protein
MYTLHRSSVVGNLSTLLYEEKFEDTKEVIKSRQSKDRQYNGQKKKDKTIQWPTEKKGQKDCKTLHRKLKIKQHEPHEKTGVKSGAPEG